jgi:hypothetical protein
MKKLLFLFFIALMSIIYSCTKEKKINIEEIKIPNYYEPYDYITFWKNQGVDFGFSSPTISKCYKDKISHNFLSIGEGSKGIIKVDRNQRINVFKNLIDKTKGEKLEYSVNNNIEYYIMTKKKII